MPKNTTDKNPTLSFEASMSELDNIVTQMESGTLPLEEALNAYKRGISLLQQCQKTLNEVEQQIQILDDQNNLISYNPADE